MTLSIAPEQAFSALDSLVQEKGEGYIYPYLGYECVYGKDGAPSCIVGHVIDRLDHAAFVEIEGSEFNELTSVQDLVTAGEIETDPATLWALAVAQNLQDQGYTWGDAVKGARFTFENYTEVVEESYFDMLRIEGVLIARGIIAHVLDLEDGDEDGDED